MKKFFLYILVLFTISSFFKASLSFAQDNVIRVFVSEKIELINGKRYYLHTVEKGQTLYSIAVAYEKPIDAIIKENNIENNLISTGQILKIPVDVVFIEPQDTEKKASKEQIYHDVKKGETLFGISKKYNVTISELEKLNPFLKDGLKAGQKLIISETHKKAEIVEKEKEEEVLEPTDEYIIHIVQKKETLFSISNLYVVPVNAIIALNPGCEKGIRPKQNLKIPTNVKFDLEVKEEKEEKIKVSEVITDTVKIKFKEAPCPIVAERKILEIALMIPFYLNTLDEINTEFTSHTYQTKKRDYSSFEYIQFYQGFLLALDSLKKVGISANIHVYDVTDDIQTARNVISKPELKKADLIIGPFNIEPFNVVANYAKDNKIKIINPIISETTSLPSSSNLISIALSADLQLERFVNHLNTNHRDKNILIVHNNAANELNILNIFKNHWKSILKADTATFKFTEIVYNQTGLTGIIDNLKDNKTNFVLCFSNNEAFVSNFIRKISEIQEEDKIVLYGLPSWQKFNNLELAYLEKLHYHYFSTSYINYSDSLTKTFILNFREQYAIDPDFYAFLGYDIGMYFLFALNEYGQQFVQCINMIPISVLNVKYEFRYNEINKSYNNIHLNFLRYRDFVLIRE